MDLLTLWQRDDPPPVIGLDQVRARSEQHRRRVRRSLWIEFLGAVVVVAVFTAYATLPQVPLIRGEFSTLMRVGSALIACGCVFAVTNMWLRGRLSPLAPSGATLKSYIADLERTRDTHRSAPWWYAGPFLPGLVLFLAGAARANLQTPRGTFWWGLTAVLAVLVHIWIVVKLRSRARALDGQIAELRAALDEPADGQASR